MKVKIVSCSDNGYWYSGNIGEVFAVSDIYSCFYTMIENNVILRAILKSDCEVVE